MQSISHAAQITPASRILYYDRPYTSIINEIFTKSNQYRVQWKYVAGFELADPMSSDRHHNRCRSIRHARSRRCSKRFRT